MITSAWSITMDSYSGSVSGTNSFGTASAIGHISYQLAVLSLTIKLVVTISVSYLLLMLSVTTM